MKKRLITILIILGALFGVTNDTTRDAVVGFSNVRGFSTTRTANPCNAFQITEAGSASVDWNSSCVQRLTLSQNLTWTASNWTNGNAQGRMWMVVTSSISSPGTITWPTTVTWASASQNAPRLSGAGNVDIFEFISIASGTNDTYYGNYISGVESAPQ